MILLIVYSLTIVVQKSHWFSKVVRKQKRTTLTLVAVHY